MIFSAIGLGILCSLLFTELTGLLAGGLISAGYVAFFLYQPERLVMTLCVTLLVTLLVRLMMRLVVLYGRRRFAASVILSYLLGWWAVVLTASHVPEAVDVRAVGMIIPGLIANDILRQGVFATLLGLGVAAVLTRLALDGAVALQWL